MLIVLLLMSHHDGHKVSTSSLTHLLTEVLIRGETGGFETCFTADSPPIVTPTLSGRDGSYRIRRKIPYPLTVVLSQT